MEVSAARPARVNVKVLAAASLVVVPLLAILVLNLGRDPRSVRSPLVGREAPGFALSPVGGGAQVALDSLRGKPLVVNFWATWCVPCFEEQAALSAGARAFPGVKFVGVIYEDEEARSAQFLKERGEPYPSLMDPEGKTAIAYGVFGVPETFFIDGGGRIVEKHVGPLDSETLALLVRKTLESAR